MRVLHINDAASSTHQLLTEAGRRGLDWRYLPLAATGRTWTTPRDRLVRAALGVGWLARLGAASVPAQLLHVHGGTVVRHTGWVPRPFVLHLHGTDIRSHAYDPAQSAVVRSGLRRAAAVLYSTPDLAEHVLPLRPDAEHFPQPIDLTSLPRWSPPELSGRPDAAPLVLFASRWEEVKGLAAQLALARAVRAALPASVRVAGLDWGPGASQASAAGVELLARRPRRDYLELLASASVVLGQCSGMLAASEVEAMGTGVPLVAPLNPAWYQPPDPPPVLGASGESGGGPAGGPGGGPGGESGVDVAALVDAVRAAVDDPVGVADALDAPGWVARHHDVRDGVDRLVALYAGLGREVRG